MNMTQKSYDRSDGETAKAYCAYCIYRNMGASRSLEKAAIEFYTGQSPDNYPAKGNIRRIERWSSQWNWVERCQDFDRDEETILRDRARKSSMEEHDRKLERFRSQSEAIGFGLLSLGEQLLETIGLISAPIQAKLKSGKPLNEKDLETLFSIPAVVRSIGSFGTQGSQLAADGLLVRQLMEKLKEAGN
jgi:hypothetical protein